MNLYDGNGNAVDISSVKTKPLAYNFSAYTAMMEKNSGVIPKAEFKSDAGFGDKMYCGGICANGKVYFAPNTADSVMVYDTLHDYIYRIGSGLGNFPFKFTGMVAYKGYLYCVPRGVNFMLRIDPVTDEVCRIELATNYPVNSYSGSQGYLNSHHYNGCISDNGYLYSPPAYGNTKLLRINMEDFSHKEIDFISPHSSTWVGCVYIPDDKIVFHGDRGFRVWDGATDSVVADVSAGEDLGIYDMVYDPRDNCLYAFGSNKFVKLDLSDYSYTKLLTLSGVENTYGTVMGIDGKFYSITPKGNVIYQDKDNLNADGNTIEDCFDRYASVCSAGMVLANDGSIYSVPGDGRLIKVSFEGVTGRLPDYIVTGRYYGKY
jgi:hypothetical protein